MKGAARAVIFSFSRMSRNKRKVDERTTNDDVSANFRRFFGVVLDLLAARSSCSSKNLCDVMVDGG